MTVLALNVVLITGGCLKGIGAGYRDLTEGLFAEDTALAATIADKVADYAGP
jgi:hypothetical protein